MILASSIGLVLLVLLYVLLIRTKDLPYVEPESPTGHLEERKAAIYENIRDANFEFLMGKLSQDDYQQTKADLQQELNEVNAEIETLLASLRAKTPAASVAPPAGKSGGVKKTAATAAGTRQTGVAAVAEVAAVDPDISDADHPHPGPFQCANCGASFPHPMRFCGQCGKPMGDARA